MRLLFTLLTAVLITGCNSESSDPASTNTEPATVDSTAFAHTVIERIYDQPVPDTIDRTTIPTNRAVILTMGQSNAANSGDVRHIPKHPVFAWYSNRYYEGKDPLVGSNGLGGSTWSRLGDLLVEHDHSDAIVFVPIAYGPSTISEWSGGRLADTLRQTLDRLESEGMSIDYILWHQGESDNEAETSTEAYLTHFDTIIELVRSYTNAPMIVAQASYYPNDSGRTVDEDILRAQLMIVRKYPNVHHGPNTDKLRGGNRHDGVHFSDEGMWRHARLWMESLRALD